MSEYEPILLVTWFTLFPATSQMAESSQFFLYETHFFIKLRH